MSELKTKTDTKESGGNISAADAVGVGFEFLGFLTFPGLCGYFIGMHWQETNPWALLVGMGIGFFGGFWILIRRINSMKSSVNSTEKKIGSKAPTVEKRIETIRDDFDSLNKKIDRLKDDS